MTGTVRRISFASVASEAVDSATAVASTNATRPRDIDYSKYSMEFHTAVALWS